MGRKRLVGGIAAAGLAGYLVAWPVPFDPVAWEPPPIPAFTGPLAPNEGLSKAVRLAEGKVSGPEDVAPLPDGRVVAATHDGKIVRIAKDGATLEVLAETGGRPLGLAWGRDGVLWIADAAKGLIEMSPDGKLAVRATEAEGLPFAFTDDLDLGPDGRVYFSDASHRFGYGRHMEDLFEARPNGRLLVYDPKAKATTVLARDLHFANGVAVSAKGDFVLVNETYRFRVTRLWLSGPKKGQLEPFATGLPGYPDGIARSPRGTFWVAMFAPRNPMADRLARRPFARKVVWRLPAALRPKPKRYGLIVELDAEGRVLRSLHEPTGERVYTVTSVEEHAGQLYLGHLHAPFMSRVAL